MLRITDKRTAGFTLVEMAIVLVIIGIILAGVMKGRDIVRGSQVKQFSQQFAQKWGTVAQTYYDKTGQQLNDGNANGAASGSADGQMDGRMDNSLNAIVDTLESVGITPCSIIKSKLTDYATCSGGTNIRSTLVEGEYAGATQVYADLVGLDVTSGSKTYRRNCVVLYNVPSDVAKGLDTAIDATEDGNSGSFLTIANSVSTATPTYIAGNAVTSQAFTAADDGEYETCILVMDY